MGASGDPIRSPPASPRVSLPRRDVSCGGRRIICRSVIETHGGSIAADNGSAQGGARFAFALPVHGASAQVFGALMPELEPEIGRRLRRAPVVTKPRPAPGRKSGRRRSAKRRSVSTLLALIGATAPPTRPVAHQRHLRRLHPASALRRLVTRAPPGIMICTRVPQQPRFPGLPAQVRTVSVDSPSRRRSRTKRRDNRRKQ